LKHYLAYISDTYYFIKYAYRELNYYLKQKNQEGIFYFKKTWSLACFLDFWGVGVGGWVGGNKTPQRINSLLKKAVSHTCVDLNGF